MSEALMRMQYIGACSLLARLSCREAISDEDRECIGRALDDCAKTLGTLKVIQAGRGWALEPKMTR
jgi:hypothetical protein